ncbi:MAG: methyltransferase domain-containing protein [Candidatus Margulisiibacteriota bacterium]
MDIVKEHFEEEANEFDQIIVKLAPGYPEMVQALVSAIPHDPEAPIKVLDLGCGTGTIAKTVKERFPNAHITCLDLAENMIEIAKAKLSAYENTRYIVSDFANCNFNEQYNVIISSLALHHLKTDDEKIAMYSKIYNSLAPGGAFYNADIILGASDFLQALYLDKWKQSMRLSVSQEDIDNIWIPKYYTEDHPSKIYDHLKWMEAAGFSNIDVIIKHYIGAVYGGIRTDTFS